MSWVRRQLGDAINLNTPNFWRWFQSSVVRGGTGQPRVVYHGTRSPLDYVAFETGAIYDEDGDLIIGGSMDPNSYLGPHFTMSPEVASRFATGSAADWDRKRYITNAFPGQIAHGRVIPVYLSIQNPFQFLGPEEDFQAFIFEHGDSHSIEDHLEAHGFYEENDEGSYGDFDSKAELYEDTFHELSDESFDSGSSEKEIAAQELGESVKHMLQRQGFDGVVYNNTFDPGQVKSIFNLGTWDRNNPNIME